MSNVCKVSGWGLPPILCRPLEDSLERMDSFTLVGDTPYSDDVELRINDEPFMRIQLRYLDIIRRISQDYIGMPNTGARRETLKREIMSAVAAFTREILERNCPVNISPAEFHRIINMEEDKIMKIPEIKRVIYSGPKTIIIWADGTKTIVSCAEGTEYDRYAGFCAAVVKKLFGSNSKVKKLLKEVTAPDKEKKERDE